MLKLSDNAIKYTIHQLFRIAGIILNADSVKISGHSGNSEVRVSLSEKQYIVFILIPEADISNLLNGKLVLSKVPSFDSKVTIPVALTGRRNEFASIEDGKLLIHADIITLSFIMLSRFEEVLIKERDKYNRFEYKNSLASKYDFIDVPIVDEYAMLLRKWLLEFLPEFRISCRKGRVIPTHDVDFLLRFGSLFKNIKTIAGGDLLARRSFHIAERSIRECRAAYRDSKNDPLILAIKRLIEVSEEAGLSSLFHFKGSRKGQKDSTYDVHTPEVKYCMDLVREKGMGVGMHGGFDSYNNGEIFSKEKDDLESVYGSALNTGRQHFLRFDINKTPQIWQDNGIENDSTLGYPEREGFRCGTCHEFYLYDLKNDTVRTVKEKPLIVMEGTLFQYRGLNVEKSVGSIRRLYQRCQAVEGDLVILWHNHNIFRDYDDKFRGVYCKFIEELAG
jgi:hypothetical protein